MILIKTTETHFYMDPHTRADIQAFRPSVVPTSNFINMLMGQGKIKLIEADLTEDATDAEYEKYFKECDKDERLATESFLSKFQVKEVVVQITATKDSLSPGIKAHIIEQVAASKASHKVKDI